MKPLIRPFLFTVARLGVFLAVTAWIVGQWWIFEVGHTRYWLAAGPHGIVAVRTNLSPPDWYRYVAYDSSNDLRAQYLAEGYPDTFGRLPKVTAIVDWDHFVAMPFSESVNWSSCGVHFRRWSMGSSVSLSHLLIVSILVFFHAVLVLIYRKRQGEGDADA